MKTLAGFHPVAGCRPNAGASAPNFHQIVDALFNGSIANLVGTDSLASGPSVNIAETKDSFRIELAAPGFDKSNFVVSHEAADGQLVVSAEKEKAAAEPTDRYTRREFAVTKFRRAFTLPENVSTEGITAKYENGIMAVTVPKVAKPMPEATRKITVEG